MADTLVAHGESTSGTKHTLEIDPIYGSHDSIDWLKWTIMGPNGKRHASVKLTLADAEVIANHLLDIVEEARCNA
ncbi:hypothetical protein PBI_ROPE_52 [Mycobacterium phage Rope]|uniref:Uncharacterized protein n=1 Tax=Mycobacterium phage Rope TaxID=2767563 RepID=A0A7G9V0A7_9CAUD|nr:hypothetical protein PBI_ROPE_52 [Mycobacterium phage Rope]